MKLRKIFSALLFLTTLVLLCSTVVMAQESTVKKYTDIGHPMPELKVRNYFGVPFTEKDIIEDKNYLVFLFNPTCYHCVEVTEMILQHEDELDETTIFWIATQEMLELLPKFMSEVKYKDSPNLIIGIDDSDIVSKLYNYGMLPQLMFYNPQKELISIHNGDMSWEEIKKRL